MKPILKEITQMFFKKNSLDYDTELLEKRCRRLIESLGKRVKWKWDKNFEAVLAEFTFQESQDIQSFVSKEMTLVWNSDNENEAPDLIRSIFDYFGGLKSDQKLLTSDPAIDGLLLCAWWPWGNGEVISMRLAVFADSLSDEQNEDLTVIFRSWFRV